MIEINTERAQEIAKKHDIKFMVLFGSQARGATHNESDIDIAILANNPEMSSSVTTAIWNDLSDMLRRDDIEVVDMNKASPTLMHAVSKDGKLLYEEKSDIYLEWKAYVAKIWMETAWLRRVRDNLLIQWADKHRTAQ